MRDRSAQGPGTETPLERPWRNRRDGGLSRTPGSRARTRLRRDLGGVGLARQVPEQGLDQRRVSSRVLRRRDQMRAGRLRLRRRKCGQHQECRDASGHRGDQVTGRAQSDHRSGFRDRRSPFRFGGGASVGKCADAGSASVNNLDSIRHICKSLVGFFDVCATAMSATTPGKSRPTRRSGVFSVESRSRVATRRRTGNDGRRWPRPVALVAVRPRGRPFPGPGIPRSGPGEYVRMPP